MDLLYSTDNPSDIDGQDIKTFHEKCDGTKLYFSFDWIRITNIDLWNFWKIFYKNKKICLYEIKMELQ